MSDKYKIFEGDEAYFVTFTPFARVLFSDACGGKQFRRVWEVK
jgi:hypothetical protein